MADIIKINKNPLQDFTFLKQLDQEPIKTYYTKILVLDKNELPIKSIEGRVTGGSISVNGSSAVRRSGSISFIAKEAENDLTDVENLLALNKKIKVLIGFENHINSKYDDIIWFPQGIFVIVDPSISHSTAGVTINLQFKDKMCLLNGDCGGKLPTSVTFDKYNQLIGKYENGTTYTTPEALLAALENDGLMPNNHTIYPLSGAAAGQVWMWNEDKQFYLTTISEDYIEEKQSMYDIIQTVVANFGGEDLAKIIIEDVPHYQRVSLRNTSGTIYYNPKDSQFYTSLPDEINYYASFGVNEECGYTYTLFTYPGKDLITSIGDTVCSVLDKIIGALGNHEYFYDIDGRFVFREKKNYLNTQYNPVVNKLETDSNNKPYIMQNNGALLNDDNYKVDFSNNSASIYTFDENTNLISSYSNAPKYTNIKNDFHIWGKNEDKLAIHYHLAIKEKPLESIVNTTVFHNIIKDEDTGKVRFANVNETGEDYICSDWRAYLYMVGLKDKLEQRRPDIYCQELLDLFDSIYNMAKKEWKEDIVNCPNKLLYWFDYIEPMYELKNISVDAIGSRVHSVQQDNINQLYSTTIPPKILYNNNTVLSKREWLKSMARMNGLDANTWITTVNGSIYNKLAIGSAGYSAQEVARSLIYQYIDFNAGINLNIVPIYYLEPNCRITVKDRRSGIFGDYVINSINVPLDAKNTMSISATRALERI